MDPSLLIVAGLHRQRLIKSSHDEDDARLCQYLKQYSPNEAQRRVDVVSGRISQIREDDITNYKDKTLKDARLKYRMLNGLIDRVQKNLDREQNYLKLFWLIVFSSLYCIMLWWQKDVAFQYALESSVHTTIIAKLTNLNGLEYGTSLWVDRGSITSSDEFYGWLGSSVLGRILTDPKCGDGICDSPDEYPGFGRFGCIPDCGLYTKTTTLTIDFKTFLASTKDTKTYWDLSNVTLLNDPGFTYNIYSDTLGDFLFAQDMKPDAQALVTVPDGNLTLYLYQTREMSAVIDASVAFDQLGVLAETMPPRTATTDFAYADPREVLASSAVVLDSINNYCLQGVGPIDPNCFKYPTTDTQIRVLGAYGIAGTITMSDGGRGRTTLVDLPYCAAPPNASAGLDDPSNKQFFKNSSVTCPDTSARRGWRGGGGGGVVSRPPPPRQDRDGGRRQRDGRDGRGHGGARALAAAGPRFQDLVGCDTWRTALGGPDCSARDAGCPAYWDCFCSVRSPPFLCRPQACKNHSDCLAAPGPLYCSASEICVPCKFCQVDSDDSITGQCPQDRCPGAGGWPQCVDGGALTQAVAAGACPSSVAFGVWSYFQPGAAVQVAPPAADKPRLVTPTNRLVGPVAVTQRRRGRGACAAIRKPSVRDFFRDTQCIAPALNGTPYGVDPTFLPSSSIYNGKLKLQDYYNDSEISPAATYSAAGVNVTTAPTARGFFPHQYGLAAGQVRAGDADTFRLYFDGALTMSQASTMVAYATEGGFIDRFTDTVTVEFLTFSPATNRFALVNFLFKWEEGGYIIWDFGISTFAVDLYTAGRGRIQLGLEITAVVMLTLWSLFLASDLLQSLRRFSLAHYLRRPGVWFHLAHRGLMWYSWWLWMQYYQAGAAFAMDPAYQVLADPQAPARPFATNATAELAYLGMMDRARALSATATLYGGVSAFCAFLFAFALLEAFRFQPRLGLISRTLEAVLPDLFNFALLFAAIFGGFVVAATLLFGHQVYKVSTLDKSVVFLLFEMISLDSTQFWAQFMHAAPAWAFMLWVWSFVFVMGFGLFNVLLALLIEGYERANSEAKEESPKSVPTEIADIAKQAGRSLTLPATDFVSDNKMMARLEDRKAGLPSARYLKSVIQTHLEDDDAACSVPLRGGLSLSVEEIDAALAMAGARPPPRPRGPRGRVQSEASVMVAAQMHDEVRLRLARSVAARFQREPEASFDEDATLLEIVQLEDMLRSLVMFRGHKLMIEQVAMVGRIMGLMARRMLTTSEYAGFVKRVHEEDMAAAAAAAATHIAGQLSVTVVQAVGLPKMDVFKSCDPFCVAFVTTRNIQDLDLTCCPARTRPVMNTRAPTWEETFYFELGRGEQYLVVVVFDYDSLTTSDLIGSVMVNVGELKDGMEVDDWFDVDRAGLAWAGRAPRLRLRLQLNSQRAAAELLSGSESAADGDLGSLRPARDSEPE